MTSAHAAIIPITLTVNDRTGLTLYAPPWEDEEGEEWQGFLGDGAKILLYPNPGELAAFVASGQDNDLSDHPGWGQVLKARPDELRPGGDDHYDLDQVYEWASGDPDPVHVSALANIVDMVARIADCCDDGALRRLVEGTPSYAELVDVEVSYQGKDGKKRWNELGDTIADSWERAIGRVESWLNWRGDFSAREFDEDDSIWTRIGAEPVKIVLADATYLTVRGEVPTDADGDETAMAFIGHGDSVAVFTELADLAHYCRTARGHRLMKLEWWNELAEIADDTEFAPGEDASFDLRKPSDRAGQLVRQLADSCRLEADTDILDIVPLAAADRDDWTQLVTEVRTCFAAQD